MNDNPYAPPHFQGDGKTESIPGIIEPKYASYIWLGLFLTFNFLCIFGPEEGGVFSDIWPIVLVSILSLEVLTLVMAKFRERKKVGFALIAILLHFVTFFIIGFTLFLLGLLFGFGAWTGE